MAVKNLGYTATDYYQALLGLLPKGPAWDTDDDFFHAMLEIASLEFARIDNDILMLWNESDARYMSYTADDWYHQWGIPDECLSALSDIQEWQYKQLLVSKISTLGMSFLELVKLVSTAIGYDNVDVKTVDIHDCNSTVDARLYGVAWAQSFYSVTVDETPVDYFITTDTANIPLARWGNELYECLIKSLSPCFSNVIFQYGHS
ncbi:MAG: hypothetical protein ACI4NC_06350 [Succinivibrio sp.]